MSNEKDVYRHLLTEVKQLTHEVSEIRRLIEAAVAAEVERATPLPTNPLEEWIDSTDVMNALHISTRKLQTLRSSGVLPFSRVNRKIYYRRCDVEQLLQNNYVMYALRNGGRIEGV